MKAFEKYYRIVAKIPKGKVASYQDIARASGAPGAARAVGNAMACNEDMLRVPCHRVVKSSGHVGGYKGNLRKSLEKARKLSAEGIPVDLHSGKINRFQQFRYLDF